MTYTLFRRASISLSIFTFLLGYHPAAARSPRTRFLLSIVVFLGYSPASCSRLWCISRHIASVPANEGLRSRIESEFAIIAAEETRDEETGNPCLQHYPGMESRSTRWPRHNALNDATAPDLGDQESHALRGPHSRWAASGRAPMAASATNDDAPHEARLRRPRPAECLT